MNEVADYIIVGAGSAGCIAANRISADPTVTVHLLEAGRKDTNPWIHVPVGYFRTMHDPKYDWCYATEPDPGLNGRALNWPRGKVLGGSSSLNGLLYVRGQQQDYDHWAQLGNHGWSWQDVGPIFESFETFHRPGATGRGQKGELQVSDPRLKRAICENWLEAAQANGYPYNPDYNGPTQEGVGHFQLTMHNGRRCSSAKAFLAPVRHRQNLNVQTDCQITRVLIRDGRARGVEVRRSDGSIATIDANREVILCAGAIGSPHILLMSGIGPAQQLKDHGIVVHRDAPEVGQNLQDHLQARMVYKCKEPTLNDEVRSLFKKAAIGLEYALFRTGPMTMAASLVFGFVKTRPELATPDVQFHIQPWSADSPGEGVHPFSAFTQSVCQLRPQSRGTITLQSSNALDYPLIRPNYLATQHDQQTLIAGIRIARRIARTQPLLSAIAEEYRPTADLQSDDELLGWARDNSTTIYHPTGTCRMGADQRSVVDPCLRVRGIAGLRVADCSIMPEIVSGNTNAPAMMIGAKIAELVLKDKLATGTMQMAARRTSYEKVA